MGIVDMLNSKQYIFNRVEQLVIKKRCSPLSQLHFRINVANHCNLNCAGCSTFSPLAKEYFLDPSVFARDCERIAALTQGHVSDILFVGGEPLLHPLLPELLSTARRHFHAGTHIMLVTNGILLRRQPDRFWRSCAAGAVDVGVSHYPIALDLPYIAGKADEFGVNCGYFIVRGALEPFEGDTHRKIKQHDMSRFPLDATGSQNISENFALCGFANSCITLLDGKLYTCTMPAYIKLFNDYFNTSIQPTQNDYIDIFRAKNIEDITNFLATPIPFCKYCKVKKRSSGHIWASSKKEMTEWT